MPFFDAGPVLARRLASPPRLASMGRFWPWGCSCKNCMVRTGTLCIMPWRKSTACNVALAHRRTTYIFFKWDYHLVLRAIQPWGAMFSGDVQETLRGSGSRHTIRIVHEDKKLAAAIGGEQGERRAGKCTGWVFVCCDIHVLVHGCARASACPAREALEVIATSAAFHRPLMDGTTPRRIEP